MTNATQTATLPDASFADRAQRRYPVTSKTATCESAAAAVADKADDQVIRRIKEAAHIFGVTVEVSQILHASPKVAEAAEEYWALPDRKLYPLNHAKDVEDAIGYLGKYASKLPYDDRRTFATNLLAAVPRTGGSFAGQGELKHALEITAGQGFCTKKEAAEAIQSREVLTRGSDRDDLTALRESIGPMPRLEREFLVKLAGVLDDVDNAYQTNLPAPEEILFSTTDSLLAKTADEHIQLKDGSIYKRADLGRIPSDAIRGWLGDGMADEVCELGLTSPSKLAAQLEILPKTDVADFVRCARSCGVEPIRD